MVDAGNFLSEIQKEQVNQAIEAAEKSTSAEIVCAVATESGRYDRAESIVGVLAGLLALICAHWVFVEFVQPTRWNAATVVPVIWQVVVVALSFVVGSAVASYVRPVRRFFVRQREMTVETERAASVVFFRCRIRSARQSGGLLLYVSLFEHVAVVLADEGIMAQVGEEFLQQLRDLSVEHLRAGRRLEAFTEVVKAAGERLHDSLPAGVETTNELPDQLLCIHPRP